MTNKCTNDLKMSYREMTSVDMKNQRFYKLVVDDFFVLQLDHTNNGQTPIYDFERSEFYLVFTTCFTFIEHTQQTGHGFRVIVEKQGKYS